jgi:3-hydroxyisobutyrate dehydrogenase-like beta-hydroxyacid dehydrogenase
MKIGFAGLGQMGRPIAANLAKSGAGIVATTRQAGPFDDLTAKGVEITADARQLAEADIVFLCLPDGKAVEEMLFGPDGLAPLLAPGRIVVDLGTSEYSRTIATARRLGEAGCGFLDAPVSGMEARAIDGTLTVMCGGDATVFDRVRPLFDCIGNKVLHVGPAGSGQLVKLINQLLFDINAAALAEVLPMSAKLGLDPDLVGEVVNSGTGRSYASEFFIPRILQGHFSDGYPMQHAYKDLVSGASLSADLGLPMPVLAAATATYQTALLQGHGAKDKGGMVRVFEDLLGVQFRSAVPSKPGDIK